MKILLPSEYRSPNSYFSCLVNEIAKESEIATEGQNFWTSNIPFNIVHIQWPEELFWWREVSQQDLKKLEERIIYWKNSNTKIVATLHNALPHRNHPNDRQLYDAVYQNADAIIHLGRRSFSLYPQANNFYVPHPNYNAQITVDPKPHERITFLSFGKIRKHEEEQQIVDAFLRLNRQDTALVITNSLLGKTPNFRKREFLKKRAYLKKSKMLSERNITFKTGQLSEQEINDYFNSADIIISPRTDSLNSGVVYMGMSFGKAVIGPNTGNINEILQTTGNPAFIPKNVESIAAAMQAAAEDFQKLGSRNKSFSDKEFSIEKVAKMHMDIYRDLLK
ncbi:glycosyltransferase [Cruoricaptor ignavus]|uniref:glycosyltransferase n=1 Tax=Cruoricaptor ignavus TaxID=1118202 RepID=UPI00370D2794